jgi:hypothetical protein
MNIKNAKPPAFVSFQACPDTMNIRIYWGKILTPEAKKDNFNKLQIGT